jgi:hypothetical protein
LVVASLTCGKGSSGRHIIVELLLALLTTLTGIERTQDVELTALAQQRAVQIQTNFSHAGVPAGLAEIIAWNNSPDPVTSFAAQWQGSPPHWAILTDPQYTSWGCGISSTADGRYFAACLFRSDGFIPPVMQPTPVQLPNTAMETPDEQRHHPYRIHLRNCPGGHRGWRAADRDSDAARAEHPAPIPDRSNWDRARLRVR